MNYKEVLKKVGAALLALTFWEIAALLIHQRILLVTPVAVARRLCTIWQVEGFARAIWFSFYHIAGGFFARVDSGLPACLSGGEAPGCRDLAVAVDGDDQKCAGGIVRRDLSDLAVRPESVGIHIVPDRNSDHISECLRGTTCRKPGDAGGRNSLSAAMAQTLPLYRAAEASPFLLSACRVTTGMAWKAGIAAEIIGVPNGSIGKMLYTAKIYL